MLFGHYPVAFVKHLIACELHRSYKSENSVFKHQHHHTGGGAQGCQNRQRAAPEEYAAAHQYADGYGNYLDSLK